MISYFMQLLVFFFFQKWLQQMSEPFLCILFPCVKVMISSSTCNEEPICLWACCCGYTPTQRVDLWQTQLGSWLTSYWKYWKPLLCRLIIAKLGWIVFFPVCLCSWQPTKCLQLSVECILFAQYMWLGCTLSWLCPYSLPWWQYAMTDFRWLTFIVTAMCPS